MAPFQTQELKYRLYLDDVVVFRFYSLKFLVKQTILVVE